jgi:hypothetical protein
MKPNLRRPEQQPDAEFFTELRERFRLGLEADATDRKDAEADVRFAAGDQWDARVKRARVKAKRPVLTENRLAPSIAQIVNDGRENKPSIQCTPMDGATEQTAEYFQGRIRQLEYECDADVAYDSAREQQVTCGRGFYRVCTYAEAGDEQKQRAAIEPIDNQFSVVWDPAAKRYDLEDADWWFVVRPISQDQHERDFGKDTTASRQGFYLEGGENPAPQWMGLGGDSRMVQVADYYYRDYDELTDDGYPTVKICATNGVEVLDETDWIDPEGVIPIIPQFGKQLVVDDEKRNYSLIRNAKDPQKLVNLYASNIAEQIAQMPKNPYVAAEGQIAGREQEWEEINEVARAVVQYKTRAANGDPAGPPTRSNNEPPIQALVTGYLQAIDAVKATMGIFDASLGAGPGDTAGVAIQKRQKESDVGNFHFSDNEARSRKKLGRILLRILPILDGSEPGERPVRAHDGKVKMHQINQPYVDAKTGRPAMVDLASPGKHAIAISTGPSYNSQRQEENERQGDLIKAAPELLWVLGDLYFRTSDGPGAQEMADRMERAIGLKSPGLIDAKDGDPRQQLQQAMQKAQQIGQQNQQLIQEVHKLAQILETRQAEADAKFNIEALKSWTQLRVAEINASVKTGIADADREGAQLEQVFNQAHEVGIEAMQHAHTVLQNQHQQDMQLDQQAQQQAQQTGQRPEEPVIPPNQPMIRATP